MRSLNFILGGISAVHAGVDRNLAGVGSWHYANELGDLPEQASINGVAPLSPWASPTNVQWAAHDKDADGSTPAPSVSFGGYTCRGYYQSPIDVPRKAMFHNVRMSGQQVAGSKSVTTEADDSMHPVAAMDSMYNRYTFSSSATVLQGTQRRVQNNAPSMYVGLLGAGGNEFGLTLGGTTVVNTDGSHTTTYSATAPMVVYKPLQFHWHFPSEHTIDGLGYPGELHIVHSRLRWFRSGTAADQALYESKGAGVFQDNANRLLDKSVDSTKTANKDACSEGTSSTCTISTMTALSATLNGCSGAKGASKEDNNPQDATMCSAAGAKYLPFLVLGFFLTESCGPSNNQYNAPVAQDGACSSDRTYRMRSPTDKLYDDGFLSTGPNSGSNKAYMEDNGEDVPIGKNNTNFNYEATFGEAMKGPYFRYQGGLTTPPCTEGVEWVLFERPLRLKEHTITTYIGTVSNKNALVHGASVEVTTGGTQAAMAADIGVSSEYDGHIQEAGGTAFQYNRAGGLEATVGSRRPSEAAIADLIKATPVHIRNNRPTVAIHGRQVQYSKLDAIVNDAANGMKYNYKRPDQMWAATWNGEPSQCQNGVTHPDTSFQSPINFVGGEVYRGVSPVNRAWLKANTYGYVGPQSGSAGRWQLMNTGHGFNVIPMFSYNGEAGYMKNSQTIGAESNSAVKTVDAGAHRNLAPAGTPPPAYFVKKLNAKGDTFEWFALQQFHFHFPSEHTVDGYQYPGEMHLVHYDAAHSAAHVPMLKYNVTQGSARRVSEEKINGKDAVVLDLTDVATRKLGAAAAAAPTGEAAGGLDTASVPGVHATKPDGGDWFNGGKGAVVLGFFLKEVTNMADPSIMSLMGFSTTTGVPYTKGHSWSVDVDSKKFASALFGNMNAAGWDKQGTTQGEITSMNTGANIDANLGAPYTRNYFNYMGGLTTPSCAEGVQFVIFTDPIEVTTSEAKLFRQNYFMNNRPTQPRGKRIILFNDMANAAQPLAGSNKMKKTNAFAPPQEQTLTTTFMVAPASGAVSTALNMFVAIAASLFALALYV